MKLKLILNSAVRLLALTLLASTANACPTPDGSEALSGTPGVLIMAHGGSDEWNQAVEQVIEPLKNHYPIEIAYGMAKTSTLQAAVNRLESQGVDNIAVVRMFISGKSFLEKTEYILGFSNTSDNQSTMNMNMSNKSNMDNKSKSDNMNDMNSMDSMDKTNKQNTTKPASSRMGMMGMEPATPIKSTSIFRLSKEGVSTSRLVDDILIERVKALSTDPSNEALLILAHGPGSDEENKQWLIDMERRTKKLQSLGQFADIQCETLREDWPGRRAQAEARIKDFVQSHNDAGVRVIVIPFRVAGFGPYQEVLQGLQYTADHLGFSPHPNMTSWVDQTARSLLPNLPTSSPTSTRITTQPTQPVNDN